MDDLVRRSDVLKTLADASINGYITHKINEIPPAVQWIPLSERMPETPYEGFGVHFYYSDCVLVAGKDWLGMAYYVTEDGEPRWEFADARTKQVIDWVEITHWMPITPPDTD